LFIYPAKHLGLAVTETPRNFGTSRRIYLGGREICVSFRWHRQLHFLFLKIILRTLTETKFVALSQPHIGVPPGLQSCMYNYSQLVVNKIGRERLSMIIWYNTSEISKLRISFHFIRTQGTKDQGKDDILYKLAVSGNLDKDRPVIVVEIPCHSVGR
jgi:hypothetical protein